MRKESPFKVIWLKKYHVNNIVANYIIKKKYERIL